MSKFVTELHIVGKDGNVFDTGEYTIPLYQRAYAWEEKHLVQLIEDINDVADGAKYYIGSLIVSKQGDKKYEVIDGQQRLTSLYILLNCLGYEVKNGLTFACRENSNFILKNIKELIQNDYSKLDVEKDSICKDSICNGINILMQEIEKVGFDKKKFCEKLSRVVIYRIEVPENTDLNRYFEIMNTRGEQLEQHDILKATLMSYLQNEKDEAIFAKIWEACSDMTGYVQMHLKKEMRETIFGDYWNDIPSNRWADYKNIDEYKLNDVGRTIKEIAESKSKFSSNVDDGYIDDDIRVRFESIIEFPYFLIHALKVFISIKDIKHEEGDSKKIIDELIDDKKLIESFNRVTSNGVTKKGKISDDKKSFSKDFIMCLLRTRFLFDKYILKREYINENSDGEWSLKELHVSGRASNKKPYYKNSKFTTSGQRTSTNDKKNKTNIMMQSALRVSYTSPKIMHWVTKLLVWLSEKNCKHIENEDITEFDIEAENIAIEAVKEDFFDVCSDGIYEMGTNTPHIVFNYLDYLLWYYDRESNSPKYTDFKFEFRNSVEHWYPQNPSEETFETWEDDGVDRFGNLCIIQRNINAKFSNIAPDAKKINFKKRIENGSLKLRIMCDLTKTAKSWKNKNCAEHEKEMISMLYNACYPVE